HVQRAERALGFAEQMADVALFRHIALYRDGLSTAGGDVGYHLVRAFAAGRVVDDHRGARVAESARDARADPFGRAGDDGHFAFELFHDNPSLRRSIRHHNPPATRIVSPVTQLDSSDARNTA